MNKYEGLFILEGSAKEEALKKTIGKIEETIKATGGKVLEVEKLDQRPFARPHGSQQDGHYVNLKFDAPTRAISELNAKFHLEGDVIRWQATNRDVGVKGSNKPKRKKPASATTATDGRPAGRGEE